MSEERGRLRAVGFYPCLPGTNAQWPSDRRGLDDKGHAGHDGCELDCGDQHALHMQEAKLPVRGRDTGVPGLQFHVHPLQKPAAGRECKGRDGNRTGRKHRGLHRAGKGSVIEIQAPIWQLSRAAVSVGSCFTAGSPRPSKRSACSAAARRDSDDPGVECRGRLPQHHAQRDNGRNG